MAEIITAPNYADINTGESTQLVSDTNPSGTIFTVKNTNGFIADNFFVIGSDEKAEILAVQSIVGQVITTKTQCRFLHKAGETMIALVGDSIRFYRAAAVNPTSLTDNTIPPDTSFTILGGGTVAIFADQSYTPYSDASGGQNYWYKFTYYNSFSTAETLLSDSTPIRGGDFGHYVSIPSIRKEAGFQNSKGITDDWIAEIREEAENEVNSFLLQAGITLPLVEPSPFLRLLTKKIAAGNMEVQSYGAGTQNSTTQDGYAKIKWAEAILTQIANGKQTLAGADYKQEPDDSGSDSGGSVNGFPNADPSSTSSYLGGWTGDIDVLDPLGGEDPLFTVDNNPR